MTKNKLICLGLYCLSAINIAQAAKIEIWECVAKDGNNKQWVAQSNYQRNADIRALEFCKRESNVPATCQTLDSDCDFLINGRSTRPLWHCVALDFTATPWNGNPSRDRTNAALSAKDICRTQSKVPDSCYINMLTCTNLNART